MWMPNENLIAQLSHFGWGAMLLLLFAIFGHLYLGLMLVTIGTGTKEFVFDWFVEKQKLADNAIDFAFYCAGIAFGLAMFLLSRA